MGGGGIVLGGFFGEGVEMYEYEAGGMMGRSGMMGSIDGGGKRAGTGGNGVVGFMCRNIIIGMFR